MQLSTFDLNLLRTLDVLLQERSVTRAAERLHLTQQAVSGALKRLREQFGDELLVQVGRRLEATPLGSALAKPIHEVVLQVGRVIETRPAFDAASSTRRFHTAASDYANFMIGAPLLAALFRQAPGMTCHFRSIGGMMFQDLYSGALDFGILPRNLRLFQDRMPADICSTALFEDDFVCVVDKDNPVGDTVTADQYAAMPHSAMWVGTGVCTMVQNAWAVNGLAPKIAASSTTFASLVSMVVGTPMVSTVPRRLAVCYKSCWPLTILECPIPVEPVVEQLSWHERNAEDPAHEFMRNCFADLAASSAAAARANARAAYDMQARDSQGESRLDPHAP